MGIEIERKFLVNKTIWQATEKPVPQFFRQGYLHASPDKTIRVRQTDTQGFLTIKGRSTGATRLEFEYEIPAAEAAELLDNFAVSEIIKNRYKIVIADKCWEIDDFLGDNAGLLLAEIELQSEAETFVLPDWIAEEVTDDVRYYNSNLSQHPYKNW